MKNISMPLACVSCDHYTHIRRIHDEQCPFENKFGERKTKTHAGFCHKNNVNVFGTQLCNSHEYPIDVMDVHPVANRTAPLEPFQEQLI
jgi:hypothetical protein